MPRIVIVSASLCAGFLGATTLHHDAAAQVSFSGKTIRLVVAGTSGSPTDMLGRQLAPFIGKQLPGQPSLVVENRPGGAGAVAANYLYNVAKPDGETIGFPFGIVTVGLLGGESIRYDPSKFRWLGAVPQTQVLLARTDLWLSTPRDLLKPASPVMLASTGASSGPDAGNRLFLEMIGAKYRHVTGYPGQPELLLALARGEANLAYAGLTLYLTRRDAINKEGIYRAVLQRGELSPDGTSRRNPQLADLPTMIEAITDLNPAALETADFAAYRSIVGALALQFGFVLPPRTEDAVVEVMRKAVAGAAADPEARQAVNRVLKADFDFVDGPGSQQIVDRLRREFDANPQIAARLRQLMSGK